MLLTQQKKIMKKTYIKILRKPSFLFLVVQKIRQQIELFATKSTLNKINYQ
jgi:hypothetical protein